MGPLRTSCEIPLWLLFATGLCSGCLSSPSLPEPTPLSFEPASVLEGIGADVELARGQPLLLHYPQRPMTDALSCTIELSSSCSDCPVPSCALLQAGDSTAVIEARVPVIPELAAADEGILVITWADYEFRVPIEGLDELVIGTTNSAHWTGDRCCTLDTCSVPTDLFPNTTELWSHVTVVGCAWATATTIGPADRIELRATAGVDISGELSASAFGDEPGPLGCAGGAPQGAAECVAGTGGARDLDGIGGGGGNGTSGNSGGDVDAVAGLPFAPEDLVPLIGGGGGGGSGMNVGGELFPQPGGGGGGVIVVDSLGPVRIGTAGIVSSTGSRYGQQNALGEEGQQLYGTAGGAGGTVMIRASALLVDAQNPAPFDVRGYERGSNGPGSGGQGRLRIDVPQLQVAAAVPTKTSIAAPIYRPPVFDELPLVSTTAAMTVSVLADSAEAGYRVFVDDSPHTTAAPVPVGGSLARFETTVTLTPGLNRLCVLSVSGAEMQPDESVSEAQTCADVAYLASP